MDIFDVYNDLYKELYTSLLNETYNEEFLKEFVKNVDCFYCYAFKAIVPFCHDYDKTIYFDLSPYYWPQSCCQPTIVFAHKNYDLKKRWPGNREPNNKTFHIYFYANQKWCVVNTMER